MNSKILIGIPCYNCHKQIVRVISKIEEQEPPLAFESIIFVDNGSTDSTLDSISNYDFKTPLRDKSIILQNEQNYGLGGSHKVIFNFAIQENFDWVIILHGDDQACIDDIPKITRQALNSSSTTLGSRFMNRSILINYQRSRIIGNKILNLFFSIISRKKIQDLGSGLNIFKVEDLRDIPLEKLPDSFNFNCELLLELFSYKKTLQFFPITWSESDQLSNARNITVACSMLKSLCRWLFNSKRTAPLFSSLKDYTSRKI